MNSMPLITTSSSNLPGPHPGGPPALTYLGLSLWLSSTARMQDPKMPIRIREDETRKPQLKECLGWSLLLTSGMCIC